MTSLVGIFEKLLIALDEETDGEFPEIYTLILKYVLQMCKIINEEKNTGIKDTACGILSKLIDRLI